MKLHLPESLLSALIGAVLAGNITPAMAGVLTTGSFTYEAGGTNYTFSGTAAIESNYNAEKAIGTSGTNFTVAGNKYDGAANTANGPFIADSSVGAGHGANNFWKNLTNRSESGYEGAVYGQTLLMKGSTTATHQLNNNGMGNMAIGGLITEATADTSNYVLNGDYSNDSGNQNYNLTLVANEAVGMNMYIGANTEIKVGGTGQLIAATNGTWTVNNGKTLTLTAGADGAVVFQSDISVGGGGTLSISDGLTFDGGSVTIASGSSLNLTGTVDIISHAGGAETDRDKVNGNGFGHAEYTISISDYLKGDGTVNSSDVSWSINGHQASQSGNTLSYVGNSDTYYIYNAADAADYSNAKHLVVDIETGNTCNFGTSASATLETMTIKSGTVTSGSAIAGKTVNLQGKDSQLTFDNFGGTDAGNVILNATGTGTINVSTNTTIAGRTEAGTYATSTFAGTVNVTGGQLSIGSNSSAGNSGWKVKAGDMNISLNGGNLYYFGYDSTLGDLTIAKDATYTLHATGTGDNNNFVAHQTLSIAKDTTLTIKSNWQGNVSFTQLTGEGSLSLALGENTPALKVTIDTVNDFEGTITNDDASAELTIGKDNTSSVHLSHTINNAGKLYLNGQLTASADGNYELASAGGDQTFSHGDNGFMTTSGSSFYLAKGGTIHLGEGTTFTYDGIASELVTTDTGLTFTVAGETTGTIFFVRSGTVNEGALLEEEAGNVTSDTVYTIDGGTLEAAGNISNSRLNYTSGTLNVSQGHKLTIDMPKDDAAHLLLNTEGAGDIEINTTKVTLTHDSTTKLKGNLIVNQGSTLELVGADTGQKTVDFSSLNSLVLNGATLKANTDNADTATKHTFNLGTVAVAGESEVAIGGSNPYQGHVTINKLTNAGTDARTLTLSNDAKIDYGSIFDLNDGDFEGTIRVEQKRNRQNGKTALNLKHATAASKAIIELDVSSDKGNVALGIATDEVTVKGITGDKKTDTNLYILSGEQTRENFNVAGDGKDRTLIIATGDDGHYSTTATLGDHLNLTKKDAGSQTFAGTAPDAIGQVTVEAGSLAFTNRATLEVADLTIRNGATLAVQSTVQTAAEGESTFSGVKVSNTAVLEGGATVNSGLDLTSTQTLTVNNIKNSPITLNGSLLLPSGERITLSGDILDTLAGLGKDDSLVLFTGVTSLELGGTSYSELVESGTTDFDLSNYFNGIDRGSYLLEYASGVVSIQSLIPEPTTATLSLLALMGLAARRRRR